MPSVEATVSDHGKPATFQGVELYGLLESVGAPAGEQLRGKELARYVVVDARDGYRVVFSIAELSPSFSEQKVLLAATDVRRAALLGLPNCD